MNFIAPVAGGGIGTFCLFFFRFSSGHARSKEPAGVFHRRTGTGWDIDLTVGEGFARNFRTTGDPLQASDGQTPSTSALLDLHASGSGEFTAEWRVNCKKNRQ